MYSDFCDQAGDVYGKTDGAPLSVAVAYEDFPAGVRALRTFQGLFDADQRPFQFDMRNAWKFDFLRISELREAAVTETARADLIIVSLHSACELPSTVKWWIETAIERREGDPGALVLLYDGGRWDGAKQPPAEVYLTQCAQKGGLDFFVKRPGGHHAGERTALPTNGGRTAEVRVRATGRGRRPTCNNQRFSLAGWK
jgi:hypothetical protein